MGVDLLITAGTVITMDPAHPRADALAVDTATGRIAEVGTRAALAASHPTAHVDDLGDVAVLPGFIDPHSHPVMSGLLCTEPAHWIAPYVGYPHYDDVLALFRTLHAETPDGVGLVFNGLDRTLQHAPQLGAADLDAVFPGRPVFVLDNSGHEGYFSTALIDLLGWEGRIPPADPVGATFGRAADGTSDGRCFELPAVLAVVSPLLATVLTDPLRSAAQWYRAMAEHGITATSEHTFTRQLLPAIDALGSLPDSPLRLSLYEMSTEPDPTATLEATAPDDMVRKVGIKLWADGSPWVGNIATSFPYLDTQTVRDAGIPLGPGGEAMMNYTRADLDARLDGYAGTHWQLAIHVNGDVGLDVVLDAYERSLTARGLLGTDHGWRIEHVGAAQPAQFARAASLGVAVSMSPFQFIYWGDLLDGTLFDSGIGAQWQRFGDAVAAGASVSFHNDGSVSPPIPLKNIQAAITRRTDSGALHGPEQRIGLDDALRAHTTAAAAHIRRAADLGSLEPGKLADLVVLSADPYGVDPAHLTDAVSVVGTWRGGRRLDLDAFIAQVAAIDPSAHAGLHEHALVHHC